MVGRWQGEREKLQNLADPTCVCGSSHGILEPILSECPTGLRPLIRDPLNLIRLEPAKGYKGKASEFFVFL